MSRKDQPPDRCELSRSDILILLAWESRIVDEATARRALGGISFSELMAYEASAVGEGRDIARERDRKREVAA